MLEKNIQAKIVKYLRARPGSYTWKQHSGQYARAGMPDVMHVERGQLHAFEVKQPGNKPTKLQQATLDDLRLAGAVCAVVYSVDDVRAIMEGGAAL